MKTIIITGGSQGIGKCMVENFARDGYNVVLNYNKSENSAKQIKSQLLEEGYEIEIFKADISKREEVKKLVEFTLNRFGNIDVLINNAGVAKIQLFTDVTEEDWDEIMNVNLKSALFTIQEVLPNMINRKGGLIINISSVWGLVGASCEAVYSASKAGLDAITKSLAKELGPSNIRVNSIAPGIIDTQMNSSLDEKIKKEIAQEIPLGKIGKPIEIYKCAKWLIEDEYTTGQIISPNGGWVI
ncbi:MAG: elongation factor P 5-aminopentanone reductase [Clostridia bacterium]